MEITSLHHFHTPVYISTTARLAKNAEGKDMLGILTFAGAPEPDTLLLSVFDMQGAWHENSVRYSISGGPQEDAASHMLLSYDSAHARWVIAQEHGTNMVALRTAILGPDGDIILSPLCILDYDRSDRGMNPILALQTDENTYTLLLHKAVFEHLRAPLLHVLHISSQDTIWSMHSNGDIKRVSRKKNAKGPFSVPNIQSTQWSTATQITAQADIAESEMAMAFIDQHIHLLVLCSPESWIQPRPHDMHEVSDKQEHWRIWLTAWDTTWSTHTWTYLPEIGLPADPSIPSHEYPLWPTVEVAITTGPLTAPGEPSIVTTMAMLDEATNQVLAHGVCLDQHGRVIQKCETALGRYPHLCCCLQSIVGVDQMAQRWRLWNWPVLQQTTLQTIIELDEGCQRAFVYAEPGDVSGRFWLIEERDNGVSISHRDAHTLAELTPALFLPQTALLPGDEEERPLNGYHNHGIIPYQGSLLLLLKDEHGELTLYQVVS